MVQIFRISKHSSSKQSATATLPVLVVQRAMKFLNKTDLKNCRQTCRTWNMIIVSSGFLPEVVDFYFDFKTLFTKAWNPYKNLFYYSVSSLKLPFVSKKSGHKEAQLKALQNLQEVYLQNQMYFCTTPYLRLKLVGFEQFPSFGQIIVEEFAQKLHQVTSLEITIQSSTLKITVEEIIALLEHLPRLQRLKIPSQLLNLVKPDLIKSSFQLMRCFEKVTHLSIQFTDKIPTKAEEIESMGILLLSEYLSNLKYLMVKWPQGKQVMDTTTGIGLNLESQVTPFSSSLHQNIRFIVESKLRLRQLHLNIEGLPLTIFNNTGFLMLILFITMRDLNYLSIKLQGDALSASLATTLESVIKSGCEVDLDLLIIYNDMESHLRNSLVISLPEVHRHLRKWTLRFTQIFENSNIAAGSVYRLGHFFPKHVNLDERQNLVVFTELTYLKIEFEMGFSRLFLDFSNISTSCPNLKNLLCIEGPEERYQSKRQMNSGGRKSNGNEMICFWHLRCILESFPKLEQLLLWARMNGVTDWVFIGDDQNIIAVLDGNHQLTISDLTPKLETLSLRGLGKRVTDKALKSLEGLKHLKSLDMIGKHKITTLGKNKLMQKISTLQEFKINF